MKFFKNKTQGFSLIELMVVASVMVLVFASLSLNFASERGKRNLKIAQNEVVTNLRRMQSNALSAKTFSGNSVQYYLMKFNSSTPDRYFIQAIYDIYNPPAKLGEVQTIVFPDRVRFASSTPFGITSTPATSPSAPSCLLVAFKLPFAKVISNAGCSYSDLSTDDYAKVKDYIVNTGGTAAGDSTVVIKLEYGASQKSVIINGVNGMVCPSNDGVNCGF